MEVVTHYYSLNNRGALRVQSIVILFISGAPESFEIGGVDQYTVRDQEGMPLIPASSMKGALRAVLCEDEESKEISNILSLYRQYISEMKEEYVQFLNADENKDREWVREISEGYKKSDMEKRFEDAMRFNAAEYLFGMRGFNHTPRLFFSDLELTEAYRSF